MEFGRHSRFKICRRKKREGSTPSGATMPKKQRKKRHIRQLLIGGFAVLMLGACTPQEAVWVHFMQNGSPQLHSQAQKIVQCESQWNPGAVSPTNDHGLFQINATYHRTNFERVTGQPWSKVYEPFWNATYAKWLYNNQGWQPWTCRKAL